jgi:uncharacterized repeat protein (TIGR03803 family)
MQASDGKLYGMTSGGGVNGSGVIFSFNPSTSDYTNLKVFDYAQDGGNPYGSFIQASDGKLYGVTSQGGVNSAGVIFSFSTTTSAYTKLKDLDYSTDGANPYGTLVQASRGKLFGLTNQGGSVNAGVIFSFDPSNSSYTKLRDFNYQNAGYNPYGSVVKASDGKLYGMTYSGGINGAGVIYSFNPTTYTYTKLKDFDYSNNGYLDGANPQGNLVQASDGKLYGMTTYGGTNGYGVIFSFDPVSSAYTKLKDFDYYNDGGYPQGSLIHASDGKLYGMTSSGGSGGSGTIFSFDPTTSTYTKLKDFYTYGNYADGIYGAVPVGSLMQVSDGKLYGVTSQGGNSNVGVIFSFDPLTSVYTKLKDFSYDNTTGYYDGAYPYGSLIQASDGKLYGMTYQGGNGYGVVFSFNPVNYDYTKLKDFDYNDGAYPYGSLMQASDGKLYGMTYQGGTNDYGVVFSYDISSSIYTKVQDFDGTNGKYPYYNSLVEYLAFAATANNDGPVCEGATLHLTATGGSSYSWTGPNNFTSTQQNPVIQNATVNRSGTYTVTVTNSGNTATASTVVTINPKPTLTYTGATGFTNSVVNPTSAGPTSIFRFEVRYTNANGNFPAVTNPRIQLDFEGNGSFDDSNDRLFYMQQKNPSDQNVKDGKDYYFVTSALAESPDWKTTIAVTDQAGCIAQFGASNGPVVISAPDVSIFANDISFSDPKPDTSSHMTVSATIHNNSGHDADNFTVHLVNQFQPNNAYPDIVVPHLSSAPGFNTVTVNWDIVTPFQPAWCPMQVFIDYTNTLHEPNELDNQAIRPFTNGKFTLPGDIKITADPNPSPALIGSTVSISGEAAYRNTAVSLQDPSCAGATITATLVETGQLAYGYTDSKGGYSVGITAPVSPGTYHVKIHITDYTLDGDTTAILDVIAPPPCIGPTLIPSITLSEGTIPIPDELRGSYNAIILQGESLTGSSIVTNQGQTLAAASILHFELPDAAPVPGPFNTPALNSAQSNSVNLPTMTFNKVGSTYIRAETDFNNNVNECSEGNYSTARILVLPPLPDITPGESGINSAYQCEFNSIGFTIGNIGGVPTGSFNVKLTVTHNSSVWTYTKTVTNVDPLKDTSVSFDFIPAETGSYQFALQCDYQNNVTEVSETNNNASVTIDMLECFPDLYVNGCGSMKVQPTDPLSPGNITINASVSNGGKLVANGPFTVDFNVAGTHYTTQITGTIDPQQSQDVSVTVPAPAYGNNSLIVTADANNVVGESAENNNSSPGSLCWDFSLTNRGCSDIPFILPIQYVGRPVRLATGLYNSGLYEASHAQVRFEVSGPGITGWLDLGYVSTFAGNTCGCPIALSLPGQFAFPELGMYQVRITADFNDQYSECDETNNQLIVDVTVSNQPDYYVRSEHIAPSLLNPDVDEPVAFDISYGNQGEGNADSMEVFTEVDEIALDSVQAPGVLGGKTNTVHMNHTWSSSIRGVHIVRAIVDHDKEVDEPDEDNNEATRAIVVGHAPNLKFDAFSVTNAAPAPGSAINITATIHNNGYTGCYATYQLFYLDNNNAEVLITQKSIGVDSGGILQLITPWVVTDPRTTLIARIINSSPIEYDATDNEATAKIGAMILTVSSPKPACSADSNGIAKVSVVGGAAPYSAIWSNGMTSDSIRVPAGTYNVQVIDAEGSTVESDSVTVDEAIAPVVTFTGLSNTYLVTDPAAPLTGNPAGGTFSGSGIAGNQFVPSDAGVGGPYTITYTYASPEGCSDSDMHTTTVLSSSKPPAPTINVVNNCGSSTLTAENYTGTLHWSTGEITESITVTTAGDYSVTQTVNGVTSDPGQATAAPKAVPSKPVITPNGPTSFCEGGTVTLTSTQNNNYQWYKDDQLIANATQQQYTAFATGAYKVTVTNAQACSSTSDAVQVTASPQPTATISYDESPYCNSGTATVTQTGTIGGTYSSITALSINSSTGAINLAQSAPGTYIVTYSFSSNGCSNTTTADVTIKTVPTAPSSITGSSQICSGATNVVYSVSTVNSATSYTWGVPSGWIITGGQGTTSINVTVGNNSGNIAVTANNNCGSSSAASLGVSVSSAPATPGTITGPTSSCAGVNNLTYSIAAVAGATSYSWTVPTGWSINGSASGTSISVNLSASAQSGNVSVAAVNTCGTSTARTLAVTVNALPSTPGAISGNSIVCAVSTQTYSITAVNGATSYTWIVPSGWTIKKNMATSISVSVKAGTASGAISVKANNACGSSAASTLTVTVITAPATPGAIAGSTSVCAFSNAPYSILPVSGATFYSWTVPKGWTINSGQGTTSIQVLAGKAGQKGKIAVTASNACSTSSARTLTVTSVTCAPVAAATVPTMNSEKASINRTVKISPNPAINNLHVELYGYTGNVSIQLLNLQGKIMLQGKMQTGFTKYAQQQLNIGNVASGVYFLTVIDENGNRQTEKVVIAR